MTNTQQPAGWRRPPLYYVTRRLLRHSHQEGIASMIARIQGRRRRVAGNLSDRIGRRNSRIYGLHAVTA